jgi:hypothetical protein
VEKLYLPMGARLFGCRKCHNLTYRSCQKAHFEERALERFRKHGIRDAAGLLSEQQLPKIFRDGSMGCKPSN